MRIATFSLILIAACTSTPSPSPPATTDAGADSQPATADAASDALPACTGTVPAVVAGLCVLDGQGARAIDAIGETIDVTVVSVGSRVPPAACSGGGPNGLVSNASATEIVLRAATGTQWTAYLVGPPAGLIAPADRLGLTLFASRDSNGWVAQTLELTRASHLLLFAAARSGTGPDVIPVLPAAELVSLMSDGVTCMDDIDVPCARRRIRLRIAFDTNVEVGVVVSGGTVRVGNLTVGLTLFEQTIDNGSCHDPIAMIIAGWVSP